MRILTSVAAAFALSVSVFACAAAQDESAGNEDRSSEDIVAAAPQLEGSWTIDDASAKLSSTIAYDFRPNGEFFRASNRVLNGIFPQGGPPPVLRESGTYAVDKVKHLLTLHITAPRALTEVLAYEYKPAPVMNGMFIPGHEPKATLTLNGVPAPGSQLAFPAIKYDQASSFCLENNDCVDERGDGTWYPGSNAGTGSTCDTNKRVCSAL
jgi:hypothetical protein